MPHRRAAARAPAAEVATLRAAREGGLAEDGNSGQLTAGLRPAGLRWLHVALWLGGAGCFAWLLLDAGPASLWRDARALGLGGVGIVAVAGLEHALHTVAWRRCFPPACWPRWSTLYPSYLAGFAVSLVTPTASLGGEVVRGSLIARGVPAAEATASVVVDRLAFAMADSSIGAVGLVLLLALAPLSDWARAGLLGGALLLGVGIAIFFALQRGGRLAGRIGAGAWVRRAAGVERAEWLQLAADETDRRIADFHADGPRTLLPALALHVAGTSVAALQIAWYCALVGTPLHLRDVLVVFSAATALDLLSFFVPGRLGVYEGARVLAFSLAGLAAAHAVGFSLVLRVEQVAWAGLGLLAYGGLGGARLGRDVASLTRGVPRGSRESRLLPGE